MNRIAGQADVNERVKEGDIIIDTPNKINSDGSRSLIYYFMKDQWALKDEVTIWVDGEKLGFVNEFKLQHAAEILPWCDKVKIKALTPVRARNYTIRGPHVIELGERDNFYWTKDRYYMGGYFNFHAIQGENGHGFFLSVQDGGEIIARDFESQGGFSGIRVQPDGNAAITLTVENFYIHDTNIGEGGYLGSTQKPPTPRFKAGSFVRNGVIARSAAEGWQWQNAAGVLLENLTMVNIDTDWMGAFQNYQATALQFMANGGDNLIRNIIVDGFGSNGFMPFSVDPSEYIAHPINRTTLRDSIFYGGRGAGSYLNGSMKNGIEWVYDNVLFGGFDRSFYERAGNRVRPLISGANTDKVTLNIVENAEAPQYVNSGLDRDVSIWTQYYANYHECPDGTPTHWNKGAIAIDKQRFYKVLNEHQSTDQRPADNPNFMALCWDIKGTRNDQEGFIAPYSMFPPDDVRAVGKYKGWGVQIPFKEKIVEEYYLDGKRITLTDSGNQY